LWGKWRDLIYAPAGDAASATNGGRAVPKRTQTCTNRCKPMQTGANLLVAFLKALLLAIACGLSALWARAGVCCGPIAPGAKPKITIGLVRGEGARRVRSARKWVADARRLVSMSRPSFGGVGALRGGDHEHQRGRQHLRQEAHVLAPRAVCTLNCILN
jgi:hypothetical protein